jgi:hypothetical protein
MLINRLTLDEKMLNKIFNLDSGDDIQSKWNRLLQVMLICKNHKFIQSISSINSSMSPNPVIECVLPSLLFIQFMSLFEEAAIKKIQLEGWKLQKKENLYNLIEFLSLNDSILDYSIVDSIRVIRNDVAHNLRFIDWSYLSDTVDIIEKELQNWRLIGNRPNYQVFANRSQAKILETEDFTISFDYEFGILLSDEKVFTCSWTTTHSLPKKTT